MHAGGARGRVIALDKRTGETRWVNTDTMIYALNHQGTMFLLGLTPDGFRIVSQFELDRKPTNSYLAHPVVSGGTLYIRGGQTLSAYDVRAK